MVPSGSENRRAPYRHWRSQPLNGATGPQAHRFIGDCAGAGQPVDGVDVFRHIDRAQNFVGFRVEARRAIGTVAEIVDRPRPGVSAVVSSPASSIGHEIRHDHVVGKRARPLRRQRPASPRGSWTACGRGRDPPARPARASSTRLRARRGQQPARAPAALVGRRRRSARSKRRQRDGGSPQEKYLQLALDHVIRLFDRVDVVARTRSASSRRQ